MSAFDQDSGAAQRRIDFERERADALVDTAESSTGYRIKFADVVTMLALLTVLVFFVATVWRSRMDRSLESDRYQRLLLENQQILNKIGEVKQLLQTR